MKGLFTAWCVGLILAGSHQSIGQSQRAAAQPPSELPKASFSFEIDAYRDVVRTGSQVTVGIFTTNTTDHPIGIDNGWNQYWVDVRDSLGSLVPLTAEGRREQADFGKDRTERVSVQPGETKGTGAIVVSQLFVLSKPDDYTIQMSRTDPATNLTVKSNIIPVTVEPRFRGPGRTHSPLISISISAAQTVVSSAGEFKVKAELRNDSAYMVNSGEGCGLKPEIFYEGGRIPVPMTEGWTKHREEMRRRPTLRRVAIQTRPGETEKCVFKISEMYQVARPGRYSVQMKSRDFWGAIVKSNTLSFTVVPSYKLPALKSLSPEQRTKPAFSLAISAPAETTKSSAELPVKVVVTNVSDHVIYLDPDEARYWTDVRDEKGQLVQQTKYGHVLTGDQFTFPAVEETSLAVPIEPHVSALLTINVAKLFDMRQPGAYTIEIDKSDRDSKAWIQSNKIPVTVVPAGGNTLPALLGPAPATASQGPPVAIALSTKQSTIRAGAGIWVDATTTNLFDRKVAIGFLPGPYESSALSVAVQVRDSKDHAVGPERLDQSSCKGAPGCTVSFSETRYLSPGESAKDYFVLGNGYDFSRPGIYTIQVVRWDEQRTNLLAQPVKAVTAVSNALTVNVVEACKQFGVIRTTRFDSEFLLAQAGKSSRRAQRKYDCDTKDNAAKECPRLIHMIEPEYTEEARHAQVEGNVVLEMSIDKVGKVSDVHVLESLDKSLDGQAVDAVQQWKFRPAVNKGRPVPVKAKAELQFACQDTGAW